MMMIKEIMSFLILSDLN